MISYYATVTNPAILSSYSFVKKNLFIGMYMHHWVRILHFGNVIASKVVSQLCRCYSNSSGGVLGLLAKPGSHTSIFVNYDIHLPTFGGCSGWVLITPPIHARKPWPAIRRRWSGKLAWLRRTLTLLIFLRRCCIYYLPRSPIRCSYSAQRALSGGLRC